MNLTFKGCEDGANANLFSKMYHRVNVFDDKEKITIKQLKKLIRDVAIEQQKAISDYLGDSKEEKKLCVENIKEQLK